MKNSIRLIGFFLAGLVLLPGCLKVPAYKCRSLESINDHCTYRGIEKNVIVRAKRLRRFEKNYLFDERISDNGLQVVYISIHNLNNKSYVFSGDDINVRQMCYQDVIKLRQKTSSFVRLAGGACASVYCMTCVKIVFGVGAVAAPLVYVIIPLGALAVTFLTRGIKSIVMNNRIAKDIKEKIIDEPVVIPSGGQYEGLVFIKTSDYTPQFTLALQEKDAVNNTITFNVDLL